MKLQYIFSVMLIVALASCSEDDMLTSENLKSADSQLESIATKTTANQYVTNSILDNPVIVWQAEAQPIPSWPAIFYSPHQDDETLGMGASIAEHVRAGRAVYVVLLSNGANSGMLSYIQQNYNPNATMQDVINARNNEFIAACIALGVHRVYIANVGAGYDESADFSVLKNEFKSVMNYFDNLYPSASHKTVSGNCDSYNPNCDKMPTHQAATTAIHELYSSGVISDIRLYRVYIYYWNYGTCDRSPSWLKPVSTKDKTTRINAINEYKYVNASIQRYGLGYWYSVQTLFDNSLNSNYEYVDFIDNDY